MQVRNTNARDEKQNKLIRTVIERVGSKNLSNDTRYISSSTPNVQKREKRIRDKIQSFDCGSIYVRSRYVDVALLQWLIRMSNRFVSLKFE